MGVIMAASAFQDGTIIQGPDGSQAVILDGYRRLLGSEVHKQRFSAEGVQPVQLDKEAFSAIPEAGPASLPDFIWDTGLAGVRPGETGHLASFKGKLHRDTGIIVMESRALDVTLLGGFHVRFTVLVVDAQDFPVPSSIPAKSVRIGVDGKWIGNNDQTIPWSISITPQDAANVANIHPAWGWDPDNLMTEVAKWQAAGQALGTWLDDIKKVGQIFTGHF